MAVWTKGLAGRATTHLMQNWQGAVSLIINPSRRDSPSDTTNHIGIKIMTTSNQSIDVFVSKWTNHISKDLALNIIKQVVGFDNFVANHEIIIEQLKPSFKNRFKCYEPIQGFSDKNDMLALFDANRSDFIKFARSNGAKDCVKRGVVSGIEFIRLGTARYNLDHDQISDVLHHTPSEGESSSIDRIIIGQWLAKTALLQLCLDYSCFIFADDFFGILPA